MGRSRSVRMLACALSIGLALAFAGCSAATPEPEAPVDAAPRPTPSVTTEPTQVPVPDDDSSHGDTANDAEADEFDPASISDLGAREGASGQARQDDNGYWYYEVVSGDVAGVICDRFDRSWWQLETIDVQSGFDCRSTIYPGQVLVPTTYDENHDHESPWVPSTNPFGG